MNCYLLFLNNMTINELVVKLDLQLINKILKRFKGSRGQDQASGLLSLDTLKAEGWIEAFILEGPLDCINFYLLVL